MWSALYLRQRSSLQAALIKTIIKSFQSHWDTHWCHDAIPPSSFPQPTSLLTHFSGFVSPMLGVTSHGWGTGMYLIAHPNGGAVAHVLRCRRLCLISEQLPNRRKGSTINGQSMFVLEREPNTEQFCSSCWGWLGNSLEKVGCQLRNEQINRKRDGEVVRSWRGWLAS